MSILTVGHSTRNIDEVLGLMKAHGVETVVDIRTVPRSSKVIIGDHTDEEGL